MEHSGLGRACLRVVCDVSVMDNSRSWSSAATEGRSPWEHQAERREGTEGKQKSFWKQNEEAQGQGESRKVGRFGERVIAQKRESRAGKSCSACQPIQRLWDFQEKDKLYLRGTELGRMSCSGCSICSAFPGKQPPQVQKVCTKLLPLLTISLAAKSVWVGICLPSLSFYLLLGLNFQEGRTPG